MAFRKEKVLEVIKKFKKDKSKSLLLGNIGIEEIPEQVFELDYVQELYLQGNHIAEIPPDIAKMKSLETIYLDNNLIRELPKEIIELESLRTISLNNNPIEIPPLEIVTQGVSSIKNYFKEYFSGHALLYEAKLLIIGEAGAGKTTLANKIINPEFKLDTNQKSTEGIEIFEHIFNTDAGKEFQVHIWDFGGQEIYHATHQFFLTKRSVYVLLSDSRGEDTDFNYWLQVVELLSDNSPLVIVQNEKQDRNQELNISGMRGRFSNLIGNIKTNLLTNRNFNSVINEIHHQFQQLPHIGTKLPKTWIDVRSKLQAISKENNFIQVERYYKICKRYGIVGTDRADFLSDYLHDLGVHLHFQDNPILRRYVILNPTWGTDAVYKILDNEIVISNNGLFTLEDVNLIWKEEQYKNMHYELLELMIKFELCYKIEGINSYIAPQLIPVSQPEYHWDIKDNIVFEFDYDFLPKGIMTRFIVRMHHYINNQKLVWREGVILERENSTAEVIQTYGKRKIRIRICGVNKKEFLVLILEEFEKIHNSFRRLKVEKQIPCNCSVCKKSEHKYFFKYERIKKFISKNRTHDICEISDEDVSIQGLVNDIFPKLAIVSAKSIKEEIKNDIKNLKYEKVFNDLIKGLKDRDSNLYNDIYQLFAKYNKLRFDVNSGVLSKDKENIEFNKINSNLLTYVDLIYK